MDTITDNMSIYELKIVEKLTVRSINVCEYNSLATINDIVKFYNENGTFLKLRNCGQKTNEELIHIAEKYNKYVPLDNAVINDKIQVVDELDLIFDNLTTKQKIILNNLFNAKLSNLNVRAYNAVKVILNSNFSFSNYFLNAIKDKSFNFRNVRNVGANTILELNQFHSEIFDFFKIISTFNSEKDLNQEILNSFLDNNFSIETEHKKLFNIDEYGDLIPIFRVINLLFENHYILDKKKYFIFKHSFNYQVDFDEKSLEDISLIVDLSRERVRQIRNNIFEELPKLLSFVLSFDKSQINTYELDFEAPLLFVDENIYDEIIESEEVNFNVLFINKILSVYLLRSHILVGNELDTVFNNNRSTHNWLSTYLIRKEYTSIFDFDKFIEDVSRRNKEKINEDYIFNFKSYLTNFLIKNEFNLLDKISEICESMILSEFSVILDSDNNIIFKRNTLKPIPEFIVEILEQEQRPLNLNEIFEILNFKYPGLCKSPTALRGSALRESNKRLIYFGRTSTYGLKEWESKYDDIKGGTIRDLAEEYLLQFDEPKHINDITEYVLKYRKDTNAKSIHYNLRAEDNSRFKFYRHWYVGLESKDYLNNKHVPIGEGENNRRDWSECLNDFFDFIKENKRMPNSSNSEEIGLYRFYYNQLKRYNEDKLGEPQKTGFIEVLTYIERSEFPSNDWLKSYEKYKTFIEENKRHPKPSNMGEVLLYSWRRNQKIFYNTSKLTQHQIELLKLIDIKFNENENTE
jgi:hypothetical protein